VSFGPERKAWLESVAKDGPDLMSLGDKSDVAQGMFASSRRWAPATRSTSGAQTAL
jgi:hypothetical protein